MPQAPSPAPSASAHSASRNSRCVLFILALVAGWCSAAWGQSVSVLTYHNDFGRTGQNTNETVLTPVNVGVNTFGRLFTYPVDGQVYAQPLYVPGVVIPGRGAHDVIVVATETDIVYALDADSPVGSGGVLWQVSLGTPAPLPNPYIYPPGRRFGPNFT